VRPYTTLPWSSPGVFATFPVYGITDDAEKAMRSIFTRRYNQIFDLINNVAPCAGGFCSAANLGRCVKEIVILEYISITEEFLNVAKVLPLSGWNNLKFDANENVAPVDLAAAKIFDFHLAADPISPCTGLNSPSNDPSDCINTAQGVQLFTQRDLSTLPANTITTASDAIKTFGLGNLNSYLSKLGQAAKPYALLSDNLLMDIHGSAAEYAFNFGILENILGQDLRSDTANMTCTTNINFVDQNLNDQFVGVMNTLIPAAKTRTLCTLLEDMASVLTITTLHPNMFEAESITGSCV